jgi:hypothetical protein
MTGNSGGWKQARFDLSAYAGQQVEVSISYVTDPAVGGVGAFVDDTQVLADGTVREHEGFESWSGFHGSGPGSAGGTWTALAVGPLVIEFSREHVTGHLAEVLETVNRAHDDRRTAVAS